jgi:mannose/cellobiose epimerase-like protein (N-acyl-D-glucosamine 2-epimerase family)
MTAVEWLLDQIQQKLYIRDNVIEQANKLFEQQIKDAWKSGDTNGRIGILKTKEQYYNETYKKGNL